jgi:formate-dependent nitrite reductase membrane component NrfD
MPVGNPQAKVGPGYHGLPIIKPPVWEWMIAVYFFVGGLAGMSGLIAMAALTKDQFELVRTAMWAAGMGAILSPALLIADLGRPMRFLNMLRVFKYQSPMSVGSWIVSSFGAFAVPGLALVEWQWRALHGPSPIPAIGIITWILVVGAGVVGIFLATYTGALLAVTAVPAWNVHRAVLPFHFGMAGLGSAAAVLEMAGFRSAALDATGFLAASAETLVLLWLEFHRHGATDRALHQGRAGWTLRAGELLEGPLALALRSGGLILPAAASFTLGALVTRFGWLWAGRSCAQDPEAVLASQTSTPRPAETRLPYSLEPAVASRLDSRGG